MLIFFTSCGDSRILRDPFRVMVAKYENPNQNPALYSQSQDNCSIVFHKRFYNILFVLPMNSYTQEDLEKVKNIKAFRLKNVMLTGDILWSIFGFLGSFITYSVEIESCTTNYSILTGQELEQLSKNVDKTNLDFLKKNEQMEIENKRLQKELDKLRAEEKIPQKNESRKVENIVEIPDIPILTGYSQFINPKDSESQDFIVEFENKKNRISSNERKKIQTFAEKYRRNYSEYKILLIGHADWKGNSQQNISLSMERVLNVKKELIANGVNELNIFTTTSGSYWPGNSEEKSGREFFRRVDMLFLE